RRGAAEPESSRPSGRRRAKRERRKQAHGAVPPSEGNGARRDKRQGIGALPSTVEAGEPNPRGPGGGKGAPSHRTVGGKHGGCSGTRNRVNATTTDSGTGEARAADGIHFPGAPHRPRLAVRGVPA